MKSLANRFVFAMFTLGFLLPGVLSYSQDRGGVPQADFSEMTYAFGNIKEVDGPVSHTFRFKNTSGKPFIIDFVTASCGCTTPEYDKAPVLPGKEGFVTVTFDPADRPGVFSKDIIITSNNRRDRTVLTITGEVTERPRTVEENYPYEIAPGLRAKENIMVFSYVARGKNITRAVELYNNSNAPAEINISAESDKGEGFYIVTVDPAVIPPKEKAQLAFTYDFRDVDFWGMAQSTVKLSVNGKSATGAITAYATVTDDFSGMTKEQLDRAPLAEFSSQYYYVGDVNKNEVISIEFDVKNMGEDTLIIRDIQPNSKDVSFSVDRMAIAKGENAAIKVALDTKDKKGRISEGVTVILNDPARPMRELRISATVN